MSTNGALGPEASKFLTVVFKHVKASAMFSMRHSHQDVDSTWNTTWFSTFRFGPRGAGIRRLTNRQKIQGNQYQEERLINFCANGFLQQIQLRMRLSSTAFYRGIPWFSTMAPLFVDMWAVGFAGSFGRCRAIQGGFLLLDCSHIDTIAKVPPYPRFYNYDPKQNRRSFIHRKDYRQICYTYNEERSHSTIVIQLVLWLADESL